jgi:hypothetical protein
MPRGIYFLRESTAGGRKQEPVSKRMGALVREGSGDTGEGREAAVTAGNIQQMMLQRPIMHGT